MEKVFPPIGEYDPGITKDEWARFVKERVIGKQDNEYEFLQNMVAFGGRASCSQMQAVFGKPVGHYSAAITSFSQRAKKYLGIKEYEINGLTFPKTIAFVDQTVMMDGKKKTLDILRNELFEALVDLKVLPVFPIMEEETLTRQQIYIDDEQLHSLAKYYSSGTPTKYQTNTEQYRRNPYISLLAKRRAKGICQLCEQKAPFIGNDGEPYLETHHIIWLSAGGEDTLENTVALCPNCHRKMHNLRKKEDIESLQKKSTE